MICFNGHILNTFSDGVWLIYAWYDVPHAISLSLPYELEPTKYFIKMFIRIACTTSLCKLSAFVLVLENKTLLACYHKIYVELIQSICCNLCASRAFLSIAIWIFYTHPLAFSLSTLHTSCCWVICDVQLLNAALQCCKNS